MSVTLVLAPKKYLAQRALVQAVLLIRVQAVEEAAVSAMRMDTLWHVRAVADNLPLIASLHVEPVRARDQ